MRARPLQRPRRRVGVAGCLLVLPFLVLAARAAHLSMFDPRGAERAERQTRRVMTLLPERGMIVDRSGAELALSIDAPSVYAVPAELEDAGRDARRLARELGVEPGPLVSRMRDHDSFLFVARWVEEERAERVAALDLPGVGILKEPRRVYPHKELAASLVGFANIDGVGVRGIEQQEDEWLRGAVRRIPVERDARGRLLAEGDLSRFRTAGGDVALTLDATLQADAEAALARAVERTGARGGIVVSLDPASGEILALAESPGFDPNRFRHLDYRSTRSRAFLDALEPGSTLKVFLVAAALEAGAVTAGDLFDCEQGSFQVPGKRIRDPRPHDELTAGEILRVSSNVGAVKIAYELGARPHYEQLRRFGFGRPTGSRFPDESAGLLRPWRTWRPLDHATIAFGQGVSVTAVQLAAATATLANGGVWVSPRLVAARRPPARAWLPSPPPEVRRAVSEKTAATVVAMLERAVGPEGTGRRAALRGVRVAGKTGTAQKLDLAAGRYAENRFIAWFVGIAPADAPRLAIAVALDEPRRPSHTGGSAAAPLFAEVAAAQLARFGIVTRPGRGPEPGGAGEAVIVTEAGPSASPAPGSVARTAPDASDGAPPRPSSEIRMVRAPTPPHVAAAPPAPARPSGTTADASLPRLHDRILLPDFRGLSVAEVRRITAKSAIRVLISGTGRAVAQEPPPGTVVGVREAQIRVRFEAGAAPAEGEI